MQILLSSVKIISLFLINSLLWSTYVYILKLVWVLCKLYKDWDGILSPFVLLPVVSVSLVMQLTPCLVLLLYMSSQSVNGTGLHTEQLS